MSAEDPREWLKRLAVCSNGLEELEEPMLVSEDVSRGLDSMPTMPKCPRVCGGVTVWGLDSAPASVICNFTISSAISHSAGTKSTSWPELLILHLPPPFALAAAGLPDRSAAREEAT